MREIDLIQGSENTEGQHAFDRSKMTEAGLDSVTLSEALADHLKPFAPFLNNGCGIALIIRPDGNAAITGVTSDPE